MTDKIECPGCAKLLTPTATRKWRKHTVDGTEPCDFAGTYVEGEGCATPSASSASSVKEDVTDPAEPATSSTPSSPASPEPEEDASTSASASPVLPGVTSYATVLDAMSAEQLAAYKAKVDANLTPFSQPAKFHLDDGSECSGPGCSHYDHKQPTLFSQPAGAYSEQPAQEMTDLGKELTARFKELFYAYDNRRSADNRSAQTTMGPSEMGTPCDRRLALSLMRMPPVNPGGDGWAAFVGTCLHVGLAEMFLWANHGTGRFAVEVPLTFDSKWVPKGTTDLIDRTLFMVDDHKGMGRWSRNKLKSQGPSRTYRVQAHVYAHGARKRGERVEHIAIIGWPRDEATLEDLYVFTEPYNPQIVKDAFERVDRIGGLVEEVLEEPLEVKAQSAAAFAVADDCRFCPFYLPNARDITRGCNGKQ